MALYGGARDINVFGKFNRELINNIISQQCVLYKYNLEETVVNIYGEASTSKYFLEPTVLNCLIEIPDQSFPVNDNLEGFNWSPIFKFFAPDLNANNIVFEVGDVIMWQKSYYEVDETRGGQYFRGLNPDYPNLDDNGNNPLETDLGNFGESIAVICLTHYVPADKLGITKERF